MTRVVRPGSGEDQQVFDLLKVHLDLRHMRSSSELFDLLKVHLDLRHMRSSSELFDLLKVRGNLKEEAADV